jgi:hypothetical protein
LEATSYFCELDGDYLQGGRGGRGHIGWEASSCVVCKLHRGQQRCFVEPK